jgi:uncharacterized protein
MVSKRAFLQRVRRNGPRMKSFLQKLAKENTKGLDKLAILLSPKVWAETDCLACANCCKVMSPTYTKTDIKRISAYLETTEKAFKEKWLEKDEEGDWLNKSLPCQFLGGDNKCTIYEVRPLDCAGFPHLTKRKMHSYMHVHEQNINYCPATYNLVQKMQTEIGG